MSFKFDFWYWENVLSQKDRIYLNDYINKNYDKKEDDHLKSHNIETGKKKKFTDTKIIQLGRIKNKINHILENAIDIEQYEFGYYIYQPVDKDYINYNTYLAKDNARYDYHIDSSQSDLFDIKLTLLINISKKPYQGGQFKYYLNDEENEIKQLNIPGNAIMLKSHLNHKVLPVTKGERNTLTFFICGPKFR